jgi:hypothetical protein
MLNESMMSEEKEKLRQKPRKFETFPAEKNKKDQHMFFSTTQHNYLQQCIDPKRREKRRKHAKHTPTTLKACIMPILKLRKAMVHNCNNMH